MPRKPLRSRLIETARQSFVTLGYDATTVESIVSTAGVSKGAFYHHFSSKADVLDAVVEEMAGEIIGSLQAITRERLPAVEKLNRLFAALVEYKLADLALLREISVVLYRDENAVIRHKIESRNIALLLPLLADIVAEGVAEGVFDVPDARETARAVLHFSSSWGEVEGRTLLSLEEHPEKLALLKRQVALFFTFVERVLMAPEGSIAVPELAAIHNAVGARRRPS